MEKKMKRNFSVVFAMLFILYLLIPIGLLISLFTGCSIYLRNNEASAAVLAVLSVMVLIFTWMDKKREITRGGKVCILLLLPLSLINWLYYILSSQWKFTVYFMAVCFCCSWIYVIRYIGNKAIKMAVAAICVLLLIPLTLFSFIDYVFGSFGSRTVVRTIDSPDGRYRAEIIDSDQGALGGNTFVDVYDAYSEMNLYFVRVAGRPWRIYAGDWGEYQDMTVSWEDGHTLLIDGVAYEVGRTAAGNGSLTVFW